jgi:conjugative transfer signal peptidase TraF
MHNRRRDVRSPERAQRAECIPLRYLGRLAIVGLFTLAGAIGSFEVAARAGLRFNVDQSMPLGAYWFHPGPVSRGSIVQSCLPPTLSQYALRHRYLVAGGSCPDGVVPVVKVLAATSSDRIVIADSGVTINGRRWPMSAIRRYDSSGHRVTLRLPSGLYACPADHMFLMGANPRSWDSRYWGCVPRASIAGSWVPVPFTGWAVSLFSTLANAKERLS